ncbi:hypothetical protein [Asticcacaulis sp. 201]|uniref:hypothetical protein n=1 Tax=Asticcacaulis sp. 201 TaxID=3028787 RepID=UPI0029161E27|nr:hypothetical protein [Asticcacaulis sp. 201]MDV6333128.1 hypothetical protein [Asticcacaulis sp. 201]
MRADMTVMDAYVPDMCRQTLNRTGTVSGYRESPLGVRGARSVRMEADFDRAGALWGTTIAGTSALGGALDLVSRPPLIIFQIPDHVYLASIPDVRRPIPPQSRDGFLPPMPHL